MNGRWKVRRRGRVMTRPLPVRRRAAVMRIQLAPWPIEFIGADRLN